MRPKKWTAGLERDFCDLVCKEALEVITRDETEELRRLQFWRRRLKNPPSEAEKRFRRNQRRRSARAFSKLENLICLRAKCDRRTGKITVFSKPAK